MSALDRLRFIFVVLFIAFDDPFFVVLLEPFFVVLLEPFFVVLLESFFVLFSPPLFEFLFVLLVFSTSDNNNKIRLKL